MGERLVTNFDYRLKREKACVHVLDFPVFKQFIFLLKTSKPYFVDGQVTSHENDRCHENRQFRGGIVIFMAVRGALS